MSEELKLDAALRDAYERWLADPGRAPDAAINVIVHFEGDVAALEAAGFGVAAVMGREVAGTARYAGLSALSTVPGVLQIASGAPKHPRLDTAVADVSARAPSVAAVGTGGLWHADPRSGRLTATGAPLHAATGAGVIVAIIDTGIDPTHPMFNHRVVPTYSSRILRLWDQGATPRRRQRGPDPALLLSTASYGVEFDKRALETELTGSGFPRHQSHLNTRDCDGHGTHVASIAAGGSAHYTGGDARRVGVAPQADIVVVKLLDVPPVIEDVRRNEVGWNFRFRDAVLYCLRLAARSPSEGGLGPKPIVINMSFGSTAGAGDGLEPEDIWLDGLLDPHAARGPMNFPSGAVVVRAAGNEARPLQRRHARIVVPAAGHVDVPFDMFDERKGPRTRFINCARRLFVPDLHVHFWWRRESASAVSLAARVPTEAASFAPVVAGFQEDTFDGGKTCRVEVDHVAPVPRPVRAGASVPVSRSHAWLQVRPHTGGVTTEHTLGRYVVRITAPAGTVVWAMCDRTRTFGFKLADALPPGVVVSRATIFEAGGRNVITVGAYDDVGNPVKGVPRGAAAQFSSRGPLRDFSHNPPRGPFAAKPDIAAPGVGISAARSKDSDYYLIHVPHRAELGGNDRFVEHDGTSMSAPVIAGIIALMLEKNHRLTVAQVRDAFTAGAGIRPVVDPPPGNSEVAHAYGAGMAHARESHRMTRPP